MEAKDRVPSRLDDHRVATMRIVNLDRDGQRVEYTFADGARILTTYRKRKKGGWRIEHEHYPAGMRIQTK